MCWSQNAFHFIPCVIVEGDQKQPGAGKNPLSYITKAEDEDRAGRGFKNNSKIVNKKLQLFEVYLIVEKVLLKFNSIRLY